MELLSSSDQQHLVDTSTRNMSGGGLGFPAAMKTEIALTWEDAIATEATNGGLGDSNGEELDSTEALKSLRGTVLGSVNGSKRHSRRRILFDVTPGGGVPKDASEVPSKRLQVLGSRYGTPLRSTLVDRSLELALMSGAQDELQGDMEASVASACSNMNSISLVQGPRHGRRESCPGDSLIADQEMPCGSPSPVRSLAECPKASSCDAKVSSGEHKYQSLALAKGATSTRRLGARQRPGDQGSAVGTSTWSQTEFLLRSWTAVSDERVETSPSLSTPTVASRLDPMRQERATRVLPRGGNRQPAGMLTSLVAQSDPSTLATSIAESEGWCKELAPFPALDEAKCSTFSSPHLHDFLPQVRESRRFADNRPGAATGLGSSGANVGRHGEVKGKAHTQESRRSWRRLFRHVSMDAQSLRMLLPGKEGVAAAGRKGAKRGVVLGLGARMVPDKKTQEYYERDG